MPNPVQGPQDPAAQSAPVSTPAPQPTMSIVSASEVAAKFTARFPALAASQKSLALIAALYANMLRNPRGVPSQKDAIADLDFYQVDLDGVRDAIADMTRIDAQSATEFATWFKKQTGREFNTKTLNFADVVKAETTEDQEQTRKARLLGDTALAIIRDLGVTNTYIAIATDAKKPKRGSLLVGIINSTAAKISKTEAEPVQETPSADWLTPLVLDDKKDEFDSLMKFMLRLQGKMQQYADQPNMRSLVRDELANAGILQGDIEERLARAQELANEALKQTNEILTLVGTDQQHFADWVDGLVDFRHMYGGVAGLFFPSK